MKNSIVTIAAILVCSAQLFGGATFRDGSLQGRSDGSNVYIQWGTSAESAVQKYTVERRAGSSGEFVVIGTISARGSNSDYEFIDRTAFKTDIATATLYQYRIGVVNANTDQPADYSKIMTVSHNVSSVKRTWGSLKAMFR